jgi:4-amino-4-deoxychorismate lyase
MNYFETIKCDDYKIFNLQYHEKRIVKTIGKNISLQEYIYPLSEELLKCKVIYNEDEILDVQFTPYRKKEIKKLQLVFDDSIEYNYKYENRDNLNKLLNKKNEADEIIIVKDNLITDTSIANIAILLDDKWYTPKIPLLHGTTRAKYLDMNRVKELDIDVETLKKAKKIALLNAMIDFDILEEFDILT